MTLSRRPRLFFLSFLLLAISANAQQAADTVVVGANVPSESPPADTSSSSLGGAGESTEAGLRDSVILRAVPDTAVSAWKGDRRFAYANDPAYWKRQQEKSGPFSAWLARVLLSNGFRYFIYVLLGGLLFFAILRIMFENNLGLFYRNRARKSVGDAVRGEADPEEDLDERLRYSLDNHEYRLAVRYLYLRSLRVLGQRGLIQAGGRSTNHEYLRQLSGSPQEAPFRFLTGAYEKVWYGEFVPGEEAFLRLRRYFEDFDKTIAV